MLERIQAILCILLFVMIGSIENTPYQNEEFGVQPEVGQQSAYQSVHIDRSYIIPAMLFSFDSSIEMLGHSFLHKAIVRHRPEIRMAAAKSISQQYSLVLDRHVLHPRPVDYYIFSLGRILI